MTLTELLETIPDVTLRGEDCEVTSLVRPGYGDETSGRVELWFEGPVDTDAPVIMEESLTVNRVGTPSARVPGLKDVLIDVLEAFRRPYLHGRGCEDRSEEWQEERLDLDLAPGCMVPGDVELGMNCRLGPGVSLHPGTRLGDNVELRAGVRVECPTEIGANTTVHANTVIGADGFGYEQEDGRHRKTPQVGEVWIGADVEVGAVTAIDRATYGLTRIGKGTKIDNQVQVSHNCQVGEHCILVGRTVLAGSVELGDRVTIAGASAVSDHVTIADGVTVVGKAGVTKDISDEGIVVSGFPAQPHREELRERARVRKLDRVIEQVERLEQRVGNSDRETDE